MRNPKNPKGSGKNTEYALLATLAVSLSVALGGCATTRPSTSAGGAAIDNNAARASLAARAAKATEEDHQAAMSYRKAAEQGNAQAQYNLGLMYMDGRSVPQDDRQAVAWFQKAANQGNSDGQTGLGYMYANGRGVPQDDRQATAWYQKAANQGNTQAQKNLSLMYAEGRGDPGYNIHNDYMTRLAKDPELASIRRKSGIGLTEKRVDKFDNHYPTKNEQTALRKYGRLMEEYFGRLCEAETRARQGGTAGMAFAQGQCARGEAYVQSVVALHAGKLTWAEFGHSAVQLDDMPRQYVLRQQQRQQQLQQQQQQQQIMQQERARAEYNRQMEEYNRARQAEQERRDREQTEERRHQETINAIRQSGGGGVSGGGRRATRCYSQGLGLGVICE